MQNLQKDHLNNSDFAMYLAPWLKPVIYISVPISSFQISFGLGVLINDWYNLFRGRRLNLKEPEVQICSKVFLGKVDPHFTSLAVQCWGCKKLLVLGHGDQSLGLLREARRDKTPYGYSHRRFSCLMETSFLASGIIHSKCPPGEHWRPRKFYLHLRACYVQKQM